MSGTAIAIPSSPAPNILLLAMVVTTGCWAQRADAAQLDYILGYQAEYSDNVTRISSEREGVSELINTASARLSYLENTGTFNARVLGAAAYNHYYHSSFENQTHLTLDAYGEAFLVQRTLSWVAADGFRRVQLDPLLPDTPSNRRNSNAWVTGPNIYLRFGAVDMVSFEGRYGRAWVEDLEIDNDRNSYAARWAHRSSARTTWSLNYEYLGVDYEVNLLNPDLTRHNYFVRADVRDARTQLTADLGRTSIEQEGFESADNWLVHLHASARLGALSNAWFRYRREYSDTGAELLPTSVPAQPSGTAGIPTLGADVVTSEPFYTEEAEFGYSRAGQTYPWALRLFYRDIDYELSPNDRLEKGFLIDVRYLFSGTLSIHLFSSFTMFDFEQMVREDQVTMTGIAFSYRMGPRLQADLAYRRFGRRSTAIDQDYTDDRFALTLTYGSRSAGR